MKLEDSMSRKYGVLNCPPTEDSAAICHKRVDCEYVDLSQIFRQQSKDFSKQFAHIYAVRLSSLRDPLVKRASAKWGSDVKVCRLVELEKAEGEKCVIIGTLFLDQRLKPSILKDISEEAQLIPQPIRTNFVSDTDTLILEDELQRIVLHGSLDVHKVVTGVVCAVLGKEEAEGGKFLVEDWCFAGVETIPPLISPPKDDQFVVLVSCLDLAGGTDLLSTQLLIDWLSGMLGEPADQERAAKVVRVILAGNSVRSDVEKKEDKVTKTTTIESSSSSLSAVKLLDGFLNQLVQFVDVDIMPGEFDPTNHTLPQQPLHYCMFPNASRFKSLHGVTNPYSCLVNGRRITGTSGQPVMDIIRFTRMSDPLDTLHQTLEWGHLSPTSPDTLPCYPFYERDPFILEARPDVYFAGNQETFQTKLVETLNGDGEVHKVRLICLPSFAKTATCAVVNLANLDCHTMNFEVGMQ
ncbi:DNA polymerase delta subunit 2-like [Macrosteles quadrilineatus]|uniref:DNA polymerase delta subunit 2-like n=1 Tax=Macrosteles quadrilineatus TaxID=74068 RepID=UPI0023E2F649|nr:DNA polymerase delta subunit 2-like [Macrosteles quadrilineatus]XP_054268248.1 DNA polymerase delta subunit 2-like [Macrosteles quadrilineatus]